MLIPTRENWSDFPPKGLHSFALSLHPQPRFYKYLWQIWTPDCPLEGGEFFESGPKLSTAAFVAESERIILSKQSAWIYNRQFPRLGPGTPFNPAHPRWQDAIFAPAWDDDQDPIWNGHK